MLYKSTIGKGARGQNNAQYGVAGACPHKKGTPSLHQLKKEKERNPAEGKQSENSRKNDKKSNKTSARKLP